MWNRVALGSTNSLSFSRDTKVVRDFGNRNADGFVWGVECISCSREVRIFSLAQKSYTVNARSSETRPIGRNSKGIETSRARSTKVANGIHRMLPTGYMSIHGGPNECGARGCSQSHKQVFFFWVLVLDWYYRRGDFPPRPITAQSEESLLVERFLFYEGIF